MFSRKFHFQFNDFWRPVSPHFTEISTRGGQTFACHCVELENSGELWCQIQIQLNFDVQAAK